MKQKQSKFIEGEDGFVLIDDSKEKLEISVTLEKYTLFSSNSEVTFTIEGEDHQSIIDQLVDAVEYFSDRYATKLMKS